MSDRHQCAGGAEETDKAVVLKHISQLSTYAVITAQHLNTNFIAHDSTSMLTQFR